LIDNPHYFEADPYKELAPIATIGFELWTMSSGIVFDNIVVADDLDLAREFARQTFNIKVDQEKIFDSITNPSQIQSLCVTSKATPQEKPWLWAVYVLVLLIPVILISVFCFGKKSPSAASHPKKTDAIQPDEEADEEMDEVVNEEPEEDSPSTSAAAAAKPSPSSTQKAKPVSKSPRKSSQTSKDSQSEEDNGDAKESESQRKTSENPPSPASAATKRTRVRRAD